MILHLRDIEFGAEKTMLLECGHAQAYDIDPVSACSRGSELRAIGLGLAMIGLPQRGLYSSMENMQLTAFPTLKARDAATTVTSNFQLIYEPYGVARIRDKLANLEKHHVDRRGTNMNA